MQANICESVSEICENRILCSSKILAWSGKSGEIKYQIMWESCKELTTFFKNYKNFV